MLLSNIRNLLLVGAVCASVYYFLQKPQEPILDKQITELVTEKHASIRVASLHGETIITEPVLLDLLKTPMMERLKGINQGGICHYAKPDTPPFNRYEHSVDVFLLLRRYGGTLEEQMAALGHDASHTVFSHVGDIVFKNKDTKNSYQDNIHESFLREHGISEVLAKHGYKIEDILHKSEGFSMLEKGLPDLCADRIQYNYHTGYIDGLISAEHVKKGYKHLHFEDGVWFFDNAEDAARLARISLYETIHLWGAAWNLLTYDWTAQAMRRAMNIGLITVDDIHYDVQDDQMWEILIRADDPMIKYMMHRVQHYQDQFSLISEEQFGALSNDHGIPCQNIQFKFRGVDPFVQTKKGLKRLTEIDTLFAQEYNETKIQAKKGWFILFKGADEKTETEKALFAQAAALIQEQEGDLEKEIVRLT